MGLASCRHRGGQGHVAGWDGRSKTSWRGRDGNVSKVEAPQGESPTGTPTSTWTELLVQLVAGLPTSVPSGSAAPPLQKIKGHTTTTTTQVV